MSAVPAFEEDLAPDAEAFVVTSPSGRTKAIVTVEGKHRCLRRDDRGNLMAARPDEVEEPMVSTRIEGME